MSDTADKLLETFESLPESEQHEVAIAILRRIGDLPEYSVTDDQLVNVAEELFQSLDAEESNGSNSESR